MRRHTAALSLAPPPTHTPLQVTAELEAARAGKQPEASLLYRDIHTEGPGAFVRHPDFEKSVSFA